MTKPIPERISDDGLRYLSKESGTRFGGSSSTMSCFRCGKHRRVSQLQFKRILGQSRGVCSPSCGDTQTGA
jgi:hypothetical protein